jgi:XTP/dITP diphosphohydrolase
MSKEISAHSRLIFMTGNVHKLEEVRSILGENHTVLSSRSLGFDRKVEENGSNFSENAKLKVEAFLSWRNEPMVMAEDSGLIVDALDGQPGLYTARYAGEQASADENMDLLLRNLDGLEDRTARFKAVICLYHKAKWHYFEGILEGRIAFEKRGTGGFGYDPIFIPEGQDKSLSELGDNWKDKYSHRARAVQAMNNYLSSSSV